MLAFPLCAHCQVLFLLQLQKLGPLARGATQVQRQRWSRAPSEILPHHDPAITSSKALQEGFPSPHLLPGTALCMT